MRGYDSLTTAWLPPPGTHLLHLYHTWLQVHFFCRATGFLVGRSVTTVELEFFFRSLSTLAAYGHTRKVWCSAVQCHHCCDVATKSAIYAV